MVWWGMMTKTGKRPRAFFALEPFEPFEPFAPFEPFELLN